MEKIVLRPCTKCRGAKKIPVTRGLIHEMETCPTCNGSGTREVIVEVV